MQSDYFEIVAARPSQTGEAVRAIWELEGMLDYTVVGVSLVTASAQLGEISAQRTKC